MTTDMASDQAQQQVIDRDGGPLLVLGGPGTGKTTVLVERWVRLATEVTEPHRVLLLVPTRERALALRDELPFRLPQAAVLEVAVHTWHALAYHLVTRYYRRLGYSQPPVRLNNAEQWSTVRDLLATEDPDGWGPYAAHLEAEPFASEVADFCVRASYRGLHDHDLEQLAEVRPEHAHVARFALRYRRHLRETSMLDYPELILAAARLLAEQDEIRASVRRRFIHVLVDDGQELAPAQLHLLSLLNLDHLVCTGDPDSAIEAFRGADPRWLDRFSEIAPGHDRVVLATCHRFGKQIGDVCTSLIAHGDQPEIDHRTSSYSPDEGTADLRCYATMAGEIDAAAREIRAAHLIERIPYERMAILLAQPSTYAHPVKRVLASLDVPYRIDSGDRPLPQEPAVRAAIDLCRSALSEADDDRVKAVLNSPLVGLHPFEIRDLEREAFRNDTPLRELVDTIDSDGVAEFRKLRDEVRESASESADATFARIFESSRWCAELVAARKTDRDAAHHLSALTAFSKALAHFVERRPGATMSDYLATTVEGFAADTWIPQTGHNGVQLLSFHASKGREWDLVCVLGVAEGLIPRAHRGQGLFDPWALDEGTPVDRAQAQLAEERRTLYVAMSRAAKRLVVSTSPGTRRATPSRFLDEAFGHVPETIVPGEDVPPLTLAEAAARHRRTLALPAAAAAEEEAAAAALASIPGVDPSRWWWGRNYTDGPALTPDGKLTTSYSRIGTYDNCPLQYVYQSVLGLDPASTYQMKFGSLIHKIFELIDQGEITSPKEAGDHYKREFMTHHRADYPNDQFARTYYTAGAKMINLWWATERSRGKLVATEYVFNDLAVNGHTIRGRIDRITRNGKGLVLTDYKTSKSAVGYDEARESLQLAIYYLAARTYDDLRRHGEPARMELVYPGIERKDRHDGSSGCDRRTQKPEEAEQALEMLKTYLDDAAAERFDPSPEADCQWCRMRIICPRWPEGKEIPK